MPVWLPWVLLVAVLVALVPWHRPDPHHEFMLRRYGLLADEEATDHDGHHEAA